ncbi:Cysteate synthase [Dissostichus eleginoides]|uniref:Cysteate synthase n=1 Tax=Dissostichus eleginoides TaxID=100907 RepID=A0AAD9B3N9_DISEL|nr:Cysteate synthase [Dissostichus eleginoides]
MVIRSDPQQNGRSSSCKRQKINKKAKGYVPKPGEAAPSLAARNAIMNYEKGRLEERKSVWEKAGQSNWGPAKAKYDKATDRKERVNSIVTLMKRLTATPEPPKGPQFCFPAQASSEKEQQQPDPVTNEVEATAPSPAPPVYPDLSSLKKPPPYEPLSQNNPFLPSPPKAIQAPQFKVKSGYLEMEEGTQKPLLKAVKTLSSVTTSTLIDLERSNEHMISMANCLSTLEDSLMLNRLPSQVVTQNETSVPDNYASTQRLDVQDSRRDTINPEDMEELKRQLARISKDIKQKRSTPTCNPPPRDPEENYDRALETCSSPMATSTPGACQEIPYWIEEDPENWAPTQTSAFTGVIEGTIHPKITERTSRPSPISNRLRSRGAKHTEVPIPGCYPLRIEHTGVRASMPATSSSIPLKSQIGSTLCPYPSAVLPCGPP